VCFISVAYTLQVRGADKICELANHVIVCGAEESFHNFIEQLRRCDPMRPPIVILHPKLPRSWSLLQTMFQPLHYVQVRSTCLCCCSSLWLCPSICLSFLSLLSLLLLLSLLFSIKKSIIFRPSIHPFIHPSACPYPFAHPSIHPFIPLDMHSSIKSSIC